MSNFLVLLIFVAFNPIKREASKSPFYLGCFNDCYSGSCSSTINQYSNERDIQFYIKNDDWYLVFNPSEARSKIVEVKIPPYFLIQRDDHDNE